MYYKATKDIKGLKEQGRWHSLDIVNEYLKNLGALGNEKLSKSFPSIGCDLRRQTQGFNSMPTKLMLNFIEK